MLGISRRAWLNVSLGGTAQVVIAAFGALRHTWLYFYD
jgi:hypothetical protein